MMDDTNGKTKFETDLQAYFPEIWELYVYGKQEPRVWEIIYAMIDMKKHTSYGDITTTYQAGKIQHVWKRENVIAEIRKKLTVQDE